MTATRGGQTGRAAPPGLQPGDRVVLVAPSGPVAPGRVERALALLRSWGLDPVPAPHLRDRHPRAAYLAGTDEDRARDLQAAWCDPATRAVLAARGGYGAARLLPLLDWSTLAAAGPRLLVGSSDVTALHLAVGHRLGLVTLFGPMAAAAVLADGAPEPVSAADLRATLADPAGPRTLPAEPAWSVVGGVARGRLAGGTLALLAASVGTPDPPDLAGCVLLVEDVREPAYRLDRMWSQLLAAGALDGVTGVVLGTFHDCGADGTATVARLAGELGVPVLAGLPVGHGPVQRTVPLGASVVLDADRGTLTVSRSD